jgi:hypothetical protein
MSTIAQQIALKEIAEFQNRLKHMGATVTIAAPSQVAGEPYYTIDDLVKFAETLFGKADELKIRHELDASEVDQLKKAIFEELSKQADARGAFERLAIFAQSKGY